VTEWQPIDSAPKDGKKVLIYANLASGFHVQEASHAGTYGDADMWLTSVGFVYNVAHWMPLPTPPILSSGPPPLS
jgi:hypothetical protein